MIAHRAQEITFSLKEDAAAHPTGKVLPLNLEVDLSKGDVYILVGAWDIASRRLGTLEIPYHVDLPKQSQDTHGFEGTPCNLSAMMPVKRYSGSSPTTVEMTVSLEVCIRYLREAQAG